MPDRPPFPQDNFRNKVAGTSTLRRGVSSGRKFDWEMSCLPAEVAGQTRKEVSNARDHYPAVPGVQEPELFDDQEQEDHDGTSGVLKVLQHLPSAHRPQGNEVGQ